MPIPKILHQVWLGGDLPDRNRYWMQTLRDKHPDWQYILWDDESIKKLPTYHYLSRCKKYSSKSNVIRLDVVNQYGGVYCDADVECFKPLDPLMNVAAFSGDKTRHVYCNAIFGAVPGHPWVRRQVERLPLYVDRVPPWGPDLFSENMDGVTIYPLHYFYPFMWGGEPVVIHPESYLVHYWTCTWH